MRIHHFSAASLCPLSKRLVNGTGSLFEAGRMVCHCWLIESSDGLVLVDTGIGLQDVADVRGRLGWAFQKVVRPVADPAHTAWAQIRALGFDPREVRHIVPTHLDLDHAGGLPDFPEAAVHVFRPELEAALAPPTRKERHRYRAAHFAHGPRWDAREPGGESWFGFDGVRALDGSDEILLVPLTGHTRGHCGVAVRTEAGWLLHAGDAYFFHAEVTADPWCPVGLRAFQRLVVTDNRMRLHNQARLRALVAEHGAQVRVHCAHCPTELDALAPPLVDGAEVRYAGSRLNARVVSTTER
jgi:glyoxylase-like metal-dependent hydrolase (beta-lactamase superfamily II)